MPSIWRGERLDRVGTDGHREDVGQPALGPLGPLDDGQRIVLTRFPEIAPGVGVAVP